jgi:hypothetical protein
MGCKIFQYRDLPIKHSMLCRFIESQGWRVAHTLRSGALVYTRGESEKELLIPTDASYSDYKKMLYAALDDIATTYDVRVDILLGKIAFPDSDSFKFSLKSSFTKYGVVPFDSFVDYATSLKTWILSGAAFVLNPANFHKKISYKCTEEWFGRCRVGQSEFGSYVMNVVFPLEPEKADDQHQLLTVNREMPFTRKITSVLYRSACLVQRAIDEDDLSQITGAGGRGQYAISANMCSAIVDMYDATRGADISLQPEWSAELPIDDSDMPSILTFRREHRHAIEDVAKELTPQLGTTREDLSGFVKKLSRGVGENEGVVTILSGSGQNNYTLRLENQEYLKAIDAHQNEIPVFVSGTIVRRGNNLSIDPVERFEIMRAPE